MEAITEDPFQSSKWLLGPGGMLWIPQAKQDFFNFLAWARNTGTLDFHMKVVPKAQVMKMRERQAEEHRRDDAKARLRR